MKLDDAKNHLQELLRVCQGKADLDKDYLRKVVQFCEDFKTWIPEVYVFVESGVIQRGSANCGMTFNLFDANYEKDKDFPKEEDELDHAERLEEWNEIITKRHADGSLKPIF